MSHINTEERKKYYSFINASGLDRTYTEDEVKALIDQALYQRNEKYDSRELVEWKFQEVKKAIENEGQTHATRLNNVLSIMSEQEIPKYNNYDQTTL